MPAAVTTVAAYLRELPADRKKACTKLRETIRDHLPAGFEERIGYGMPSWVVPHSIYPDGYHCDPKQPLPFMGFASQEGHIGLYHMGLYTDPDLLRWFQDEYAKAVPTKLDMGKSCVRLKKIETIPWELIGELCTKMTPRQWIELYEAKLKR